MNFNGRNDVCSCMCTSSKCVDPLSIWFHPIKIQSSAVDCLLLSVDADFKHCRRALSFQAHTYVGIKQRMRYWSRESPRAGQSVRPRLTRFENN